jgi:hypothetical protein
LATTPFYDVQTGKLISEVFGDEGTQSLSPDAPEWAKLLEEHLHDKWRRSRCLSRCAGLIPISSASAMKEAAMLNIAFPIVGMGTYLTVESRPFANLPELKPGRWGQGITAAKMKECIWVHPELVSNFEFLEWTDTNHVRHVKFVGLRTDMNPKKVIRELEC